MSNDLETKHLKDMIVALREELEKLQHEEREHIQQAVAESSADVRQLRFSVIELRDQLELRESQYEETVQKLRLQHHHEIAELHQTIAALREQLEKINESTQRPRSSAETASAAGTSH